MIPRSEKSAGEGIGYPLQYSWASLVAQLVKNLQCGRPGFDAWVGKIPGEGKGFPLQYSSLENSVDCIVHGVAKSQGRLSDFNFTSQRPNEGNGNPLDYSSLENSMDRGAWQAMSMGSQRVGRD